MDFDIIHGMVILQVDQENFIFLLLLFCGNTSSLIFNKNEWNFQGSKITYLSKDACLKFVK